ncbi:hypothetical protein [Emcibacter sp.]|uniref:hypothetical protein n=1 Tax=Emcibacter sp. TaxID=1979954 RepID=UPI002AA6CF85|nr:hypothetical protein [Emcibacter sp.]
MKIKRFIQNYFQTWRIYFLRWYGEYLLNRSIKNAQKFLEKNGPLKLLVDTNVWGKGISHETTWIDTGTKLWGGVHPIQTGYTARIPVHSPDNESRIYKEIRYLPGIALLAEKGLLKLCTYSEIEAEKFRQPVGRFLGYYCYDLNLFGRTRPENLDGVKIYSGNAREEQLQYINTKNDEPFRSIVNLIGQKYSLDAHHIHTAELYEMDCFLNIDFKLGNSIKREIKKKPLSELKTKIVLPSELAAIIGLKPINTRVLSYKDSSFPIRSDLSRPKQERIPPKKRKK